jgi:hypothetical protein
MRLEEIALSDDYFVERKLYPNVDFYSGIIYSALQIPGRDVHGDVRYRPYRRLDQPLDGNDHRKGSENRSTAAIVYR